jgi:hypothetical protein
MNMFSVDSDDYRKMSSDSKIALIATVDDEGEPHITFMSSLQPLGQMQLTAGQFCEGISKHFFIQRPKIGWLIFTAQKEWWTGTAEYTHTETTGTEFEMYNNKPLFRYNSYFGIGKVHYFDLKSLSPKNKLKMPALICGALASRIAAIFERSNRKGALNAIGKGLFDDIGGLKFLCHIDADGYPVITPAIQATSAGKDRIVFSGFPFGEGIRAIPEGAKTAALALTLKMESVLIKGVRHKGAAGFIEIERVYNSMPPFPGYIYPEQKINKVEVF